MSFLIRLLRQLLTAIWVLLGLYCICEVGVRLYDARTGNVTQHDEGDPELVVKSWTVHHELKPLQKVVRKSDQNRKIQLTINSRGFRGPDPLIPKPQNVYRIVCLGDERVLGPHVEESETFVVHLQQLLQSRSEMQVEIINAGVPDYCPLLSLLQYEHSLASMQANLVLLNFDMSDVADDYRFRRHVTFDESGHPLCCIHPGLELRKLSGNQLFNEVLLIPRWGRQTLAEYWTSRLFAMPQTNICSTSCKYLWLEEQAPDWSIHIQQALEPVQELQRQTQSEGTSFLLLMCPAPFQVSEQACSNPQLRERIGIGPNKVFKSEHPFEVIFEYCRTHQIPLCDASPPFLNREEGEKLFLRNSIELSPEGHSLLARSIAVYLVKNMPGCWRGIDPTPSPSTTPLSSIIKPSESVPRKDSRVLPAVGARRYAESTPPASLNE